jgi:hypothetical protein
MKFEEALKAMREGKSATMKYSKGFYFLDYVKNKKNGKYDIRLYYQEEGKVTQRLKQINTRFITMFDWEVIEDVAED